MFVFQIFLTMFDKNSFCKNRRACFCKSSILFKGKGGKIKDSEDEINHTKGPDIYSIVIKFESIFEII